MNELTFEEFCNLPMQYTMGIAIGKKRQANVSRQFDWFAKEVVTPYNPKTMEWGEGRTYYFLDGDKRCFDTVDQVYVAYMEKVCGVA